MKKTLILALTVGALVLMSMNIFAVEGKVGMVTPISAVDREVVRPMSTGDREVRSMQDDTYRMNDNNGMMNGNYRMNNNNGMMNDNYRMNNNNGMMNDNYRMNNNGRDCCYDN